MAASSQAVFQLVAISALLVFPIPSSINTCQAETAVEAVGPTAAAPLNLTGILEKGGQYTTLMRLLKETQVGGQIQSQLDHSYDGLTVFAPTDNAFNNLKAGTLNGLTPQEQVSLVLYHVLPRYYSLDTFETTSNPVRTQASGSNGIYSVNITSTSSQVNVSTGVDETQISNKLYSDFPLAVYSVDSVLLPYDIFGAKSPSAAPAPSSSSSSGPPKKKKDKGSAAADAPSSPSEDSTTSPSAASFLGGAPWAVLVAAILCLMSLAPPPPPPPLF